MGKVSTWQFVLNHLTPLPPLERYSLTGRTVLVVGVTAGGLGFEAAKHFARMNPRKLIVTCRQEEKGLKVISGELLTFVACISIVLTCVIPQPSRRTPVVRASSCVESTWRILGQWLNLRRSSSRRRSGLTSLSIMLASLQCSTKRPRTDGNRRK